MPLVFCGPLHQPGWFTFSSEFTVVVFVFFPQRHIKFILYGEPVGTHWLRAGRPKGRISSPGRVKNFLHVIQTGSGVHPTSYPIGTAGCFPGVKRQGREADHSS
jgi:hypothetical protein